MCTHELVGKEAIIMTNRFKKLYELANKIHINEYKKEYEELIKTDDSFSSFDDYVKHEKNRLDSLQNKNIDVSDRFICRDKVIKDNIQIDLYLFHSSFYDEVKLDENYKLLPLTKKDIYEYGAGIIYSADDGDYSITGVFVGCEDNKDIASDKYEELKNKIKGFSEEEVLDELETYLLKKIT